MLRIYVAEVKRLDLSQHYPLSAYRLSRLEKLRDPEKRRESIGVELLLNEAVSRCAESTAVPLDIARGTYGKPYLRDGAVFFSLSHSGGYAAVAVADFELGLDLQKNRPYQSALAQRFYTEDERSYVEANARPELALIEIWCKKESYIKALGTGLHTPLSSFSVHNLPGFWHENRGEYQIAVFAQHKEAPIPDEFETVELAWAIAEKA